MPLQSGVSRPSYPTVFCRGWLREAINEKSAYHVCMKSEPARSEEFDRFDSLIRKVIAVPRAEIQRRLAEHKRESDANPNKRGPKKKIP